MIYVITFIVWIGCRLVIHNACCAYPIIEAYQIRIQTVTPIQMYNAVLNLEKQFVRPPYLWQLSSMS